MNNLSETIKSAWNASLACWHFFSNAEKSAGTSHGIQFFGGSTSGPFIAISVYRISSKRRWIIEKIPIEKTIMRLIRRIAAKRN
jgi:hypothetical protein